MVAMRPPLGAAPQTALTRPNGAANAAGAGLSTAREPCYNPDAVLEFRILGPLEVLDGETPVPLGGRNQRALLTLLLLRANEPVSTERLVDELWGEHPPRTATTSLQNAVSQLRKLLGPGLLHTRPAGYLLELDGNQLDLARFERLAREARTLEPPERAQLLREALALWRGPALADSELEDFAQAEIHRLEELRLGRARGPDRGRPRGRTPTPSSWPRSRRSCAEHPLRERLRAQLMLALYRSGRQADALAAYHDARRTLVDELGIEPGPELQALYGSILRQERSLVRGGAAGARGPLRRGAARASRPGGSSRCSGRAAGGVAGHELAALLAERFELDTRRPRPRLRLAGDRGPERDRAAARRAPPRARPRPRAVAAARLARRAAAAASARGASRSS